MGAQVWFKYLASDLCRPLSGLYFAMYGTTTLASGYGGYGSLSLAGGRACAAPTTYAAATTAGAYVAPTSMTYAAPAATAYAAPTTYAAPATTAYAAPTTYAAPATTVAA